MPPRKRSTVRKFVVRPATPVRTDARDFFSMIIKVVEQRDAAKRDS